MDIYHKASVVLMEKLSQLSPPPSSTQNAEVNPSPNIATPSSSLQETTKRILTYFTTAS